MPRYVENTVFRVNMGHLWTPYDGATLALHWLSRGLTASKTLIRHRFCRVLSPRWLREYRWTDTLLLDAASGLIDVKPTLLVDGGVENFNSAVDELVDSGLLKRLLAQTDISFSNSLIESWWRALKHQWLFLNTLDTVSRLEKLVAFYVDEHNTRLPHSAFPGQTPDEMYFGTGNRIPDELDSARKVARQFRMEVNRATSCPMCNLTESISN